MANIELLAPAGDLERLKVTLLYGADAVYVGGLKFGLRANATNFTLEQLKEGCEFAHHLHKKVYVTMNIVFHEEDRVGFQEYVAQLAACGIDAVIVSDPYVMEYMVKHYPQIEVHVSTQASTTNYQAALFYQQLGAKRVVLARELSKTEIMEIINHTNLEVEVFIHGAMCTCYSGRCALSNYVTNRDANRGGCAQVCRFAFETANQTKFTLATKDLNMASYIQDLMKMRVASLKVEGRMRSLYYLATVISSYRGLLDHLANHTLTEELQNKYQRILTTVANREVSSHYFLREAGLTDQYYTGRQEISNQEYLGLITGYDEEKKQLILIERNYFKPGDQVEIFTPDGSIYPYTITDIYDENNHLLTVARHPQQILKLPFTKALPPYSMLRLLKKGAE